MVYNFLDIFKGQTRFKGKYMGVDLFIYTTKFEDYAIIRIECSLSGDRAVYNSNAELDGLVLEANKKNYDNCMTKRINECVRKIYEMAYKDERKQ